MRQVQRFCRVGLWALVALGSIPARAQQVQGSITGTVTDTSNALVQDVTVTALEPDTGFTRNAVTNNAGVYEIPLLPAGRYNLAAKKEGFKTATRASVELLVDQHIPVDFQLEVGDTKQTVEVHATTPVTNTENATTGATIEQQKVSQIPLNGRNFLQLTLISPGVAPGTSGSENSNRGGAINVNGLRESMNSFWLDGLNDTSVAVGTYAVTPPIDSVQEFNIETGLYDARYGTNAGAQVNVKTKSGTNQLHGSAYEYLRNSALDTRNFFDPNVPPFRRNQFGSTLGGPISIPGAYRGKDRTFFFVGYEGLRERRGIFRQGRVPSLAERSGDFSGDLSPSCPTTHLLLDPLVLLNAAAPLTVPGNNLASLLPLVGATGPDPAGLAMVNLYPQPNIANAGCGAANFIAEGNRRIDTDSIASRVDHRWGSKDTIYARYNITSDREFRPFNEDSQLLAYGINVNNVNTMAGIDWTHIFSPSTFNEFKVGYNRWNETLNNQDEGNPFSHTAPLNIAGTQASGPLSGVPRITFSGYEELGSQINNPQHGAVNTYEVADTLTQLHGNHSLAFGFDIRPIKRGNFTRDRTIRSEYDFSGVVTGALVLGALQQSLPPAQFNAIAGQLFAACPPGRCTFGNGVADALLGIPQDWINGFEVNISGTGTEYDYFATDTWRVKPNFTLSLGVRYEYNSLVTDKNNHFSNFDFSSTACDAQGALLVAGTSAATVECPQLTPLGTLTFVPVGKENLGSASENRALQHPDRNNFAPRIGFSWQPFHDKVTVLRGGYGVFFDQTFGDVYFQRAANPPFVQVNVGQIDKALPLLLPAIQAGQLPLLSGGIINNAFALAAAPLFPAISPFQLNFQDSLIQEWSFDVQRELPGSWMIEAGYVGTRGLRLPRGTDPNQPDIALALAQGLIDPVTGAPLPQSRRFPIFPQNFVYTDSSGKSAYHALQVQANRRVSKDLSFIMSYTYGHAIDTNSTFMSTDVNANAPQNSLDLAAEKASSDFDIRHRLSLAYVYDLPFGNTMWRSTNKSVNYAISAWQLAGIFTAQTGSALTPVISGNTSCTGEFQNFGALTDRPNVAGSFYPSNQTPNHWVLPGAFSNPFVDAGGHCAFGNAGRNTLRGPGLSDLDFSLVRHFRITESKSLEFRAEMFNLLNHANFATPERDVASASFGQIFNTVQPLAGIASGGPGDPREIQFALRFIF